MADIPVDAVHKYIIPHIDPGNAIQVSRQWRFTTLLYSNMLNFVRIKNRLLRTWLGRIWNTNLPNLAHPKKTSKTFATVEECKSYQLKLDDWLNMFQSLKSFSISLSHPDREAHLVYDTQQLQHASSTFTNTSLFTSLTADQRLTLPFIYYYSQQAPHTISLRDPNEICRNIWPVNETFLPFVVLLMVSYGRCTVDFFEHYREESHCMLNRFGMEETLSDAYLSEFGFYFKSLLAKMPIVSQASQLDSVWHESTVLLRCCFNLLALKSSTVCHLRLLYNSATDEQRSHLSQFTDRSPANYQVTALVMFLCSRSTTPLSNNIIDILGWIFENIMIPTMSSIDLENIMRYCDHRLFPLICESQSVKLLAFYTNQLLVRSLTQPFPLIVWDVLIDRETDVTTFAFLVNHAPINSAIYHHSHLLQLDGEPNFWQRYIKRYCYSQVECLLRVTVTSLLPNKEDYRWAISRATEENDSYMVQILLRTPVSEYLEQMLSPDFVLQKFEKYTGTFLTKTMAITANKLEAPICSTLATIYKHLTNKNKAPDVYQIN